MINPFRPLDPPRRRPARPLHTRVVLRAAMIAAGTVAVLTVIGRSPGLPGLLGFAVVASLASYLAQRVAEPTPPLPQPAPGLPDVPPDSPFARIDRLADRLAWSRLAPHHFDTGVRPVLVELADDRLRRRHGVDRRVDPHTARALLGDDLWQVVDSPRAAAVPGRGGVLPPVPTVAELTGYVDRLEQL